MKPASLLLRRLGNLLPYLCNHLRRMSLALSRVWFYQPVFQCALVVWGILREHMTYSRRFLGSWKRKTTRLKLTWHGARRKWRNPLLAKSSVDSWRWSWYSCGMLCQRSLTKNWNLILMVSIYAKYYVSCLPPCCAFSWDAAFSKYFCICL